MNIRAIVRALTISMTAFSALPSLAADDISLNKDLTAVIALQGLPCGQVVAVRRQGDNDYIASCQNKNRYHVFVNAEGRVVVQKQ